MRKLLHLAVAIAVGASLSAREPARARRVQLRVPVSLESQERLGPSDFQVSLDGKPARILAVKAPGDDQIILLVLDVSGDIADFDPAREAIAAELAKLPARTYVSLLHAQDGLAVLRDPTPDREAVKQIVQDLPVAGKAGLLDTVEAVERIADSMAAVSPVRVTVLYITDSNVRNYREDFSNPVINSSDSHDLSRKFPEALIQEKFSKLENSLARRQTPLYLVHLHYRGDALNEAYQNGLKGLAELTGGSTTFCRSTVEIPGAIEHAFQRISAQYSITVALPERLPPVVQVQVAAERAGEPLAHRTRFVLKEK
ncbi:MAG TPA: hypothetical protein VMZ52_09395 [Bryobacteraceae bacterium]|nr:hypothetical protein [Bryobacteraceae bacterium]